jgi:hypothetical protein
MSPFWFSEGGIRHWRSVVVLKSKLGCKANASEAGASVGSDSENGLWGLLRRIIPSEAWVSKANTAGHFQN